MYNQIIVDKYNVVVGFCTGDGYVKGGIDVPEIPADFEYAKYKYEGGEIVPNPEYASSVAEGKYYDTETGQFVLPPLPEPTAEERQAEFAVDIDYRVSCLELGIN